MSGSLKGPGGLLGGLPEEAAVTEVQRRHARVDGRRRWAFRAVVASMLLGATFLALAAWMSVQVLWYYGGRSLPAIEAHFKHGSIGAELANGMPYRMLKALPKVFPEYFLPEGDWSHFGLILEDATTDTGKPRYDIYRFPERPSLRADGVTMRQARLVPAKADPRVSRGLPIGFATGWRLGIEVAWFNCAVCHTGVVRMPGDGRDRIVPGMPANTVNLERLFLALFDMAVDKRFTFAEFRKYFDAERPLALHEQALWEWLVVPNVRAELIARRSELLPLLDPRRAPPMARDPTDPSRPARCEARLKPRPGCHEAITVKTEPRDARQRPDRVTNWGPGRVDTFNPYKLINFAVEADCLAPEERVGVSDFPAIFAQGPRARQGMHLHWDGNNASLSERNLSAALGAGVNERTVDHASLARLVGWLADLEPPASPYINHLDQAAVERGRRLYMAECATCHGHQGDKGYVYRGARLGQIEPISYVATDRGRLDSYTPLMEKYQKDRLFCTEPEHRFRQFKKTDGYANMPLDGLWLRAPYLHNGSVPTLKDLLATPAERPMAFRRGADHITLDPVNGGFAAPPCLPDDTAEPGVRSFCFDTRQPGNGNGGHLYGTDLAPAAKADLLAYLLTF